MIMSASDIALKAPNQSVAAANGVTYAYRRFGAGSPGVLPLVMLQHFRGNLDDWDPLLGALASCREVIVVDNAERADPVADHAQSHGGDLRRRRRRAAPDL